jgi:Sphingosine kinase and enzymes related to eukaryotic diacylglycerol kinase
MYQVMLISNPMAGSVSPRHKEVIVNALRADFKLEVADTEGRNHATELARDAVDRGFDAVLAFGGDGTINEAAQGVIGSDTALGTLPGGTANVLARSIGIPRDPIDATAYIARRLRSGQTQRINVGRVNERYFLFSCGMGLDAEVVKRVESDPEGKARKRDWLYVKKLLRAGALDYRRRKPQITFTPILSPPAHGEPIRVVSTVCCNARPFTYLKNLPVDVCPLAQLDKGLDFLSLDRIPLWTFPGLAWGMLKSRKHIEGKHATYLHDTSGGTLEADVPLPVQADGDYLGEWTAADIRLVPHALDLLA